MTSTELPRCPTCGVQFVGATACRGYCSPACWPEVVDERRAEQHEPTPAKGTAQPPSLSADTDAATGRTRDRNRKPARRGRSSPKRNALVNKTLGYRRFFAAVAALDKPLSVGAVAVWCWLWTCAKAGRAKLTTRKLAQRFGVDQSTATRWTGELARVGLIETLRRGKPGRSATIVRVRYSPDTKPDGQP
jgi:DNA-binding transcriptional ArsR family regulator